MDKYIAVVILWELIRRKLRFRFSTQQIKPLEREIRRGRNDVLISSGFMVPTVCLSATTSVLLITLVSTTIAN